MTLLKIEGDMLGCTKDTFLKKRSKRLHNNFPEPLCPNQNDPLQNWLQHFLIKDSIFRTLQTLFMSCRSQQIDSKQVFLLEDLPTWNEIISTTFLTFFASSLRVLSSRRFFCSKMNQMNNFSIRFMFITIAVFSFASDDACTVTAWRLNWAWCHAPSVTGQHTSWDAVSVSETPL